MIDNQGFLDLPHRLYPWPVVSRESEEALLKGAHPLSDQFTLTPFVVHRGGQAAGRCAITTYPDSDVAYLGFFEAEDDTIAHELLSWAETTARGLSRERMIGPVDGSFWLRYRMKVDHFDVPYAFEPYNQPGYHSWWTAFGYSTVHRYSSSFYPQITDKDLDAGADQLVAVMTQQGYRVESLRLADWDQLLPQIYSLVMELYSTFPVFNTITFEAFAQLFGPLRTICDPHLITVAWQEDTLVGFSIVLPDYGPLTQAKISPVMLARLMWRKHNYSSIVALYMGSAVRGIGPVMATRLLQQCQQKKLSCVGALIAEHTSTAQYAPHLITHRNHYELLGKDLSTNPSSHE
ncbi:MAG: hypothetical protein FWG15_01840 [Propionibacteriaceae bacterium]|nr:hypothetical protein [Propionibacteriaceae bacterium]